MERPQSRPSSTLPSRAQSPTKQPLPPSSRRGTAAQQPASKPPSRPSSKPPSRAQSPTKQPQQPTSKRGTAAQPPPAQLKRTQTRSQSPSKPGTAAQKPPAQSNAKSKQPPSRHPTRKLAAKGASEKVSGWSHPASPDPLPSLIGEPASSSGYIGGGASDEVELIAGPPIAALARDLAASEEEEVQLRIEMERLRADADAMRNSMLATESENRELRASESAARTSELKARQQLVDRRKGATEETKSRSAVAELEACIEMKSSQLKAVRASEFGPSLLPTPSHSLGRSCACATWQSHEVEESMRTEAALARTRIVTMERQLRETIERLETQAARTAASHAAALAHAAAAKQLAEARAAEAEVGNGLGVEARAVEERLAERDAATRAEHAANLRDLSASFEAKLAADSGAAWAEVASTEMALKEQRAHFEGIQMELESSLRAEREALAAAKQSRVAEADALEVERASREAAEAQVASLQAHYSNPSPEPPVEVAHLQRQLEAKTFTEAQMRGQLDLLRADLSEAKEKAQAFREALEVSQMVRNAANHAVTGQPHAAAAAALSLLKPDGLFGMNGFGWGRRSC